MCWYFYFSISNPFWYRHLTCLMLMTFAHFLLLIYFGFKPWIYCRANPGNLSSPSLTDSTKKILSIFSFQKNNVFWFYCLKYRTYRCNQSQGMFRRSLLIFKNSDRVDNLDSLPTPSPQAPGDIQVYIFSYY